MPGKKPTPFSERLWAQIAKAGPDECWLWTGAVHLTGYGNISEGGAHGRSIRAHRAAYEDAVGPIPPGLHVLHRCDVRLCCNPAHLWVGTNAENMADRDRKGRQRTGDRRGEKSGHNKLTEKDVLAIRIDPRPNREIAATYGVKRNAISDIKLRKTWKHLIENTDLT